MRPSFIYSPRYVVDIGEHVFPTGKFGQVAAIVSSYGDLEEPGLPSREELLSAHEEGWVDKVLSGRMSLDDEVLMELPFSPKVSIAHQLQAAGTVLACRRALENGLGLHVGGGSHHAFGDHGEGFCVLNDLAVAALTMLAEGRIKRAAVIDLDVHQGNGTAAILGKNPSVFTFSMHQDGIYPESKPPSTLDVGLRAGTKDEDYLKTLDSNLPKVFQSGPELVIYQAGVDCSEDDLLGGLALTGAGLKARDRMVFEACARKGVPVVVTLGGGYAKDLSKTALLHAQTLIEAVAVLGPKKTSP